jgi:anaerobic magnesium-protoporphyrin IX monomethyl ester cyclase
MALVIPPTGGMSQMWCPNLPIGLAYIAAVLEKAGVEVAVFDCQALELDHKMLGEKLASFQPDIVGITAVTPTIDSAMLVAQVSKSIFPKVPVILGGPHATFSDSQVLSTNPDIDIIVRGEGEQTILELLQTLLNKGDLQTVLGISFRVGKEIVRTPTRPFIQKLDDLPRPAYHFFALKKYQIFNQAILPILTSRGCPFQCAYCVSSRMAGKGFRARDPKLVVDELEWLRDTYHASAFSFYDDAFTYDNKRTISICDEIKRRNLGIPWDCQTRVDRISEEVLKKMKEAGCQLVSFGAESGCQKILDSVNKKTTVEMNEKAVKMAKEVGLSVALSVIIGYPGETDKSLKQTFDFIKRVKPDYVYLCLAAPFPGTDLRKTLENLGWSMSADLGKYGMETEVFKNPLLTVDLAEARREFYNHFYSWRYIFREWLKGTFYSKNIARTAFNDRLWRMRATHWFFGNLRKIGGENKNSKAA